MKLAGLGAAWRRPHRRKPRVREEWNNENKPSTTYPSAETVGLLATARQADSEQRPEGLTGSCERAECIFFQCVCTDIDVFIFSTLGKSLLLHSFFRVFESSLPD